MRLALATWTRRDPDRAFAWAQAQAPSSANLLLPVVGFALAQTDPPGALRVAETVADARTRRLLLTQIAQTWMARDSAAAEAWLRGLPSGPEKDAALAGVATATAPVRIHRDADGGAAGPVFSPGSSRDGSALAREDEVRREFERRLRDSPADAARWLSTLPGPDVGDDLLRRLAHEWLLQDRESAVQWFRLHVPSPSRRREILETAGP
jgi:hypothetical protein